MIVSLDERIPGNSFLYSVYGITLKTNKPLSFTGLNPYTASHSDCISIEFVNERCWPQPSNQAVNYTTHPSPEEPIACYFSIEKHHGNRGDFYHLCYRADAQIDFEVDVNGRNIIATGNSELLRDVTSALLGSVLSCTMRLRGHLCLHGSVIKVGHHAIILLGNKGAGKSTTAAKLALRGHAIVSDDIAVMTNPDFNTPVLVQPGYPALRLWPQSVHALLGSDASLPRVFKLSEKRYFHAANSERFNPDFHNQALPLAAIYILGHRSTQTIKPAIIGIDAKKAVMHLMAHRSASFLELDNTHHTSEFTKLSQIASNIPIRYIQRHHDLQALDQLCECIESDVATFSQNTI